MSMAQLIVAIRQIPKEYFTRFPGGWPGEISVALTDAVFSIGARYSTPKGKGVGASVARLRDDWAKSDIDPRNSLALLVERGEKEIRQCMGNGKVSPGKKSEQYKSQATIQAARSLVQLGVNSAEELGQLVVEGGPGISMAKKAYVGVPGLGPVTFDYFLMLLGWPGVKADRMLTRFVQNALEKPSLTPKQVREILLLFYDQWPLKELHSLVEFEHGIWLYQRENSANQL